MRHKANTDGNAFSILTLDDDPIMTSTVQAYFQRSGYRVDVENDPYRAIERLRRQHYDILLLDFLMSPICGDQVVEQVRQFDQDIFILLLTGHKSMAPPIKTIRALDIQGYYEKSDRFDQLELLVEFCAKSIQQLRTIKRYKDGLSAIMDSLPQIYDLRPLEHITDSILQAVGTLLDCSSVILTLDAARYQAASPEAGARRFLSRAAGAGAVLPDDAQAEELLAQLSDRSSLVQETRMFFSLLDNHQSPMGFLAVTLTEPPKYDQVQLMEIFARQVSSAICNARLHALVQEKNSQLDQTNTQLNDGYLEMIRAMRRIVDAKDLYTRGHSDRVSYYAVKLAQRLGHAPQYCEQVRVAGLFHDVGKLSIPDEILLKNGRLTAEEYEVIKTHPRIGADILSLISQFRPILPGVLSHHERMDGSGYPQGLRGDEIPEMARIIAVADSFDAMTSDRQYRPSLGFSKAMDELDRCKGTQLDAAVVDAFQAMVREPGFWDQLRTDMGDAAPCQAVPK